MKRHQNSSYIILSLTLLIAVFGIFMVYSASWYSSFKDYGDKFVFAKKQLIGVIAGVCAMVVGFFYDTKKLKKLSFLGIIASCVLLILVFLPVIGVEVYGAKRWMNLGFTTIQPSEIAKFAIILFMASYMSHHKDNCIRILDIIPMCLVVAVPILLIFFEPNLSITVCISLTVVVMLIYGGLKLKVLVFIGIVGLLALPVLIVMEPYRLLRLIAFLDPWASPKGEGYQLIQSLYAISNGGLFGVGFLNSRQGLKFLTFSESDFILSIIAEEFGLFGVLVLMICYLTIFYHGIKIAIYHKDRFSSYLALGISSLFIIQSAINFAVVSGSIPPTGLPLPLISSGSTQVVMFMFQMSVLARLGLNERAPF